MTKADESQAVSACATASIVAGATSPGTGGWSVAAAGLQGQVAVGFVINAEIDCHRSQLRPSMAKPTSTGREISRVYGRAALCELLPIGDGPNHCRYVVRMSVSVLRCCWLFNKQLTQKIKEADVS